MPSEPTPPICLRCRHRSTQPSRPPSPPPLPTSTRLQTATSPHRCCQRCPAPHFAQSLSTAASYVHRHLHLALDPSASPNGRIRSQTAANAASPHSSGYTANGSNVGYHGSRSMRTSPQMRALPHHAHAAIPNLQGMAPASWLRPRLPAPSTAAAPTPTATPPCQPQVRAKPGSVGPPVGAPHHRAHQLHRRLPLPHPPHRRGVQDQGSHPPPAREARQPRQPRLQAPRLRQHGKTALRSATPTWTSAA